jgi:hypothetical protein
VQPRFAAINQMSHILDEIAQIYPSLANELLSLEADEASDSRFMAELASHVVDLFERQKSGNIAPALELAERLIAGESETERQAAITGFLETVQNVASHRAFGATAFEHFLGPKSQTAWFELCEIWRGKTTLAEVVAAETGAALRPPWWQFWRKPKRRSPRELLNEVQNAELRKIIEQITRE